MERITFLPATEESEAHVKASWSMPCAMSEENWPGVREQVKNAHIVPDMPANYEFKCSTGCETICDCKVYSLWDKEDYGKIVLYFHGGAYVFDADPLHVAVGEKIAMNTSSKVVMPCYKLAPDYTYREAYALCEAVYDSLLKEGKEITIMGDSAGAGIAMGFCHYAKEHGIPVPAKMILISPWVDAEMQNPEIDEYVKVDPFLRAYGLVECATWWADDKSLRDPMISPKFGDMDRMPVTLSFAGTAEAFYPDIKETHDKMIAAGIDARLVIAEGLTHVYPIMNLEQSAQCMQMMYEFVNEAI